MRRVLLNRWTLQVVSAAGLVVLALFRVDLGEVADALNRADYWWAGLALAVLTLGKVVAAARWQLYLVEVGRPPLLGLMGAYTVGTLLNTVLPLRAGDFAKVQIVASRYGLPRSSLGSSVFVVEAALDLVTLLLLLLIGLAFLNVGYIPALILWPFVFLAGAAFAGALLASNLFPHEMPWQLPSFIPHQLREIIRNAWPGFIDGMGIMRRSRLLGKAFSLHVTEWLLRALVFYLFGLSFDLDTALPNYLVLTVTLSVVTFFPVTFMNIGTYQVVITEVLGAAGVPRSEAFAFAVTAQALTHLWIILAGLLSWWLLQLSRPTFSPASDPSAEP